MRTYCCLNNLGSIMLNEINAERRNVFACYSTKWQKHKNKYLLTENSIKDKTTSINTNILLLEKPTEKVTEEQKHKKEGNN